MKKTIRFDPLDIAKIEEVQKKVGTKDFSKTVKYLLASSLDKRSYTHRGIFIRTTGELLNNANEINRIGILLNQLVRLYAQGRVPQAGDLAKTVKELQDILTENLIAIGEISSNLILNA